MWALFINCITKKYADFSGRASRKEYWSFVLFLYIVICFLFLPSFILGYLFSSKFEVEITFFSMCIWFCLCCIASIAMLLPALAVSTRRLHDKNISGWWQIFCFIPYIYIWMLASLVFLVLFCLKGTDGDNQFGPDPLEQQL